MTILSAHHSSRIRNRSMGVLHLIAADESCEVSDILALLPFPSQPAPAASTPAAAPADVQAEEVPPVASSADIPDPAASATVDAQGDAAGKESTEPAPMPKPVRGRPETIRSQIIAVHAEHPEWPSKRIAEHLGISEDAVRACASRKKIKLVSWWDYQRTLPPEQRANPARPAKVTRRDELRSLAAEHPDWTAKELAFAMGIVEDNVRSIASQISMKLPKMATKAERAKAATTEALKASPAKPQEPVERAGPPTPRSDAPPPPATSAAKPKRVTLADKIRAHIADHPDATARDVADATGGTLQAIGWAAQKAGITLRKYTAEERSEATARGLQTRNRTAPVPAPKADAEPFDDDEPAPVVRRVMKAPTGRFYLRNAAGNFVHQSLQKAPNAAGPLMTSDRKWAWFDTMERYRGAKKLWPELAEMRKEAASA